MRYLENKTFLILIEFYIFEFKLQISKLHLHIIMFKRHDNKKNSSSESSYESYFSDQDLHNLGFQISQGTIVQETESLWDYRQPITLRFRKIKTVSIKFK